MSNRVAHGPPLSALVVDVNVGDCEIGARLVGHPAELTHTMPSTVHV